jgi:hypothetical protein
VYLPVRIVSFQSYLQLRMTVALLYYIHATLSTTAVGTFGLRITTDCYLGVSAHLLTAVRHDWKTNDKLRGTRHHTSYLLRCIYNDKLPNTDSR